MNSVISISNLNKIYKNGFVALKNINLEVKKGEIFALLGPNGAGKTTLISIICGITNMTSGKILVSDFDIIKNYRKARALIGLVPQELTTEAFESVWKTVSFSRGLFGLAPNPEHIESVLKSLSLWDKRNNKIITLSGGMKRRLLIAKALSHEPKILFLDEPTAGVDVELRKEMWQLVHRLRESGVTIILTTHYIDEAEEMADRVGVINKGEIILVEDKSILIRKLGSKQLIIDLAEKLNDIPKNISTNRLSLSKNGSQLVYTYDANEENNEVASLLQHINQAGIVYKDIHTKNFSLEDIFVNLVKKQ